MPLSVEDIRLRIEGLFAETTVGDKILAAISDYPDDDNEVWISDIVDDYLALLIRETDLEIAERQLLEHFHTLIDEQMAAYVSEATIELFFDLLRSSPRAPPRRRKTTNCSRLWRRQREMRPVFKRRCDCGEVEVSSWHLTDETLDEIERVGSVLWRTHTYRCGVCKTPIALLAVRRETVQ